MSNTIKLEVTRMNNDEWPTLKIKNLVSETNGYLMPFRFSFFQVCGSRKGEGDYGSGDHTYLKLKDIVSFSNNPDYELKIEVVKCLNDYLHTCYGDVGCNAAFTLDCIPYFTENMQSNTIPNRVKRNGGAPFDEFYRLEDMPFIDEFINETIKFIADHYKLKVS